MAAVIGDRDPGPNYLADLITHELLGEIAGADYFERQNHRDLHVDWSPDSKWCVATYDARFGFDLCDVLEIQGRQFTQTKIGDHIHKELAGVVQAQAQSKDFDDPAGLLHVRIQPNEQLLLRVAARTNPKALEEIKTYYAFFEGTYDLKAKKWLVSRAGKIPGEIGDSAEIAYEDYTGEHSIVQENPGTDKTPEEFNGRIFPSAEERCQDIDKQLNDVYSVVRWALPANRFAKVKEALRVWLKQRDALPTAQKQCPATESRIRELQDLLWQ